MNTLILNPGSRWLKVKVYSQDGEVLDSRKISISDFTKGLNFSEINNIGRIGVRVVHGGNLKGPIEFNKSTKKGIEEFSAYAPLHNPIALSVLERAQSLYTDTPIFCVFDTDFHSNLSPEASTYPIDSDVMEKYGIRRYGFHGIALESILKQLKAHCEKNNITQPQKILCAHLGGGSSVTSVENGTSIATSMGATPLEGVMMITRSGSVDPGIFRILQEKAGMSSAEVSTLLNTSSGIFGLAHSSDTKKVIDSAMLGDQPEALAFNMYTRSIIQHIFALYGVMQGADAIVFSGGIGFRNEYIRPIILKETEIIGLTEGNTYAFEADEAEVIFTKLKSM